MDEMANFLDRVRSEVKPDWNEVRRSSAAVGAKRLARKQSRNRMIVRSTLAAVAVVGLWVARPRSVGPDVSQGYAAATGGYVSRDGIELRAADPTQAPDVLNDAAGQCTAYFAKGTTQLQMPGASRLRVLGPAVDITVVATSVAGLVAEFDADVVVLKLQKGTAKIHDGDRAYDLEAGGRWPSLPEPRDTAASPRASEPRAAVAKPKSSAGWRQLVKQARYDEAYRAMHQAGVSQLEDKAEVLLAAADAARLSGHSKEAQGYLRRVLKDHRRDPSAYLAAFTLGRVYLDELGDPTAAASAFGLSRQLSPTSDVSEDALANEIESWSRANNPGKAKALAQDYLNRYPHGRRLDSVKHFGGMK